MVGSVLLQRMREENDFAGIEPAFFSTSNPGGAGPAEANGAPLLDAKEIRALASCEALISCQGGDYTKEIYKPLRQSGWKGYWIDAASTLAHERRHRSSFSIRSIWRSSRTVSPRASAPSPAATAQSA